MSRTAHLFMTAVALASVLFIAQLVRGGRLRAKYALLWLSVGVGMILLSVSPGLLDRVSLWIGVDYGPAVLFMAAITLLLFVSVHFSWELSRLEERVRVLAEELAIREADEPAPPGAR